MDANSEGWATPLPRGWPDRMRVLALPALLVAIASLGVYRSAVLQQSSWQGASFGMFATYDNDVSRMVRVTVEGPNGSYRAALPSSLTDDAIRLRVLPTRGAADQLARSVLGLVSERGDTEVRVEVWRIRLRDRDGELRLRTELLVAGAAAG